MKRYLIETEDQLKVVAPEIINLIETYRVICFYGEMGAGKTTLIKVLCEMLGVQDVMSSPTFSIVNEYRDESDNPVYHFDFYRIEKPDEALDIGVEEYFYSGDFCFIEWPERIRDLIPEDHLKISINLVEENSREVIVEPNDR